MIPRATSTLVSLTEQEASVRKDKSINNDFDYYSVWSRGSSSSYDDLLRDRSSPSVKNKGVMFLFHPNKQLRIPFLFVERREVKVRR